MPLIFLDTNPIIRYLTQDNADHAARARALFEQAARGEVTLYVSGVPAYLTQIDDRRPLLANAADRILAPGAFLHDEPRFLLLQELGDPGRYMAILEAIANKLEAGAAN